MGGNNMPWSTKAKNSFWAPLAPKLVIPHCSLCVWACPEGRGVVRGGGGGWHDTWVCCGLQLAAPIGQSPLTAALPLNRFPP